MLAAVCDEAWSVSGAARPDALVARERGGQVVRLVRDALGEDEGVLDRLGRALRLERRHRVRRVAEQGDPPERPLLDRRPDVHRAAQHRPAAAEALEQLRAPALDLGHGLLGRHLERPRLLRPRGVLNGHGGGEQPAGREPVRDAVPVRAEPVDVRPGEVEVGDLLGRHDAAVDDGAGEDGVVAAGELRAEGRLEPVGGDRGVGAAPGSVLEHHLDAVVVLLDAGDARAEVERPGRRPGREHGQQVGAEEVELGRPEVLLHRRTELGAEEHGVVVPAPELDGRRQHADLAQRRQQPERLEQANGVRTELQRRADGGELRRLLEHLDRHALARERDRGGQPADAARRRWRFSGAPRGAA